MLHPELHDLPEFKQWLVTTLEPMCDADPLVMSDYIVALLKHDAPMSNDQWKEFIARELVDFLEDKVKPFVEDLMVTLQTRSFVPEAPVVAPAINPASAAAGAGPTPVSSYRPGPPSDAPTGPSMPQQIYQPEAGPSSGRTSNGQPRSRVPEGDVEMGDGSAADPSRKCRDYHGKGYCMRGVNCPYEHSEDVIIPTPEMMFGQFPFAPPGHPMDGRGRGRGRGGRGGRGGPPMHGHSGAPPFPFMPQFPFPGPPGPPGPPGHPGPHGPPPQRRSGGPNNDNREFWGINKPPEDRNGNTLVITDIPNQKLSVQPIRDYFSQFGEVTNVALEARSARALVSFTSNAEAYQAWKSDEAVFGSRHVKVLWHRPRPGQGAAGAEALEKSAKLIANLKAIEQGGRVGVQGEKKAILAGPEARLAATLAELEAKDRRGKKETLIAEQKVLLKRASEGTQEEKKAILGRLKELAKEVEELRKPAPKKEENGDVEMGQSEESRLGQELAKYGMETKSQGEQDELMKLNAQLSALREKATTLGIPASTAARYSPYSRGSPIRARGRGRGRGGPPRPMRLDNRTREIVIAGEAFHSDADSKAVREYFESTGGLLEAYEGGVKVAYPNREMAEKVLAMGTKEIPELNGKFSATWYTGASQPSTTTNGSHAPEVEMVEEAQRGEREDED